MKKSLKLALFITVSLHSIALATDSSSSNFKLDEDVAQNYKLKAENLEPTPKEETILKDHTIKKVEIEGGYIEKLISKEGLIVAEKKVIDNEIVERILNEYHPNKTIYRKIITKGDNEGFYLEEYYPNGKLSNEAVYINNNYKLGTEKKYDTNGTLRQEIPWVEIDPKMSKKAEERTSQRKGYIKTYYPNGSIAGIFSVGKKGKNIFFDIYGNIVKQINKSELLDFSKEDIMEDCSDVILKLSVEELVKLYEDEGDISYSKCGLPYRENFTNEINITSAKQNSKISFDETGMLRRMTPYFNGYKQGKEKKFDRQGNLVAEINYNEGLKDGVAIGYFPTHEIAFKKNYKEGKVVGDLTCYFPTGEEAADIHYENGLKDGVAYISAPEPQGIEFRKGKLLQRSRKKKRNLVSKLDEIAYKDTQCLNVDNKKQSLLEEITAQSNIIKDEMSFDIPKVCSDPNSFNADKSRYICRENGKILASYTPEFKKSKYSIISYFYDNSLTKYEVPYNKKKRQGIARAYDENRNIIKEVIYNRDNLEDTSRTFYENGITKDLYYINNDKTQSLSNSYTKEGKLTFSLNYDENKNQYAYISKPEQNKDIHINFYEGEIDNIREVNIQNPLNYVEYNFSLNEYGVYRENKLIKAGKLCFTPQSSQSVKKQDESVEPSDNTLLKEETSSITNTKEEISKNTLSTKEETKTQKALEALDNEMQSLQQDKDISTAKTPATLSNAKEKTLSNKELQDNVKKEPLANKESAKNASSNLALPPKEVSLTKNKENIQNVVETSISKSPIEYTVENAIIPSPKEKQSLELKAQNLGPIEKPSQNDLIDVVEKESLSTSSQEQISQEESKIEKFYYPNGNIRKSIKTKGTRTEEVKEYSKTGLLMTDTIYNDNNIIIEKYYGTGEIKRKSIKNYDINPITSFVLRQDFYNSGLPRYEIKRLENSLLFSDKEYLPEGGIKIERIQTSPLSFKEIHYDSNGSKQKEIILYGNSTLIKEYDGLNLSLLSLNNKEMPINLAQSSDKLLNDNAKIYGKGGSLLAEYKSDKKKDTLTDYYSNGKKKLEIILYTDGQIDIKSYDIKGSLEKFAYLSPSGDLHIQKPDVRVIPSYRERYWVDYNNPLWIENQDKYQITSIGYLNLEIIAYILTELKIDITELLKTIYSLYNS